MFNKQILSPNHIVLILRQVCLIPFKGVFDPMHTHDSFNVLRPQPETNDPRQKKKKTDITEQGHDQSSFVYLHSHIVIGVKDSTPSGVQSKLSEIAASCQLSQTLILQNGKLEMDTCTYSYVLVRESVALGRGKEGGVWSRRSECRRAVDMCSSFLSFLSIRNLRQLRDWNLWDKLHQIKNEGRFEGMGENPIAIRLHNSASS